MPKTLPTLFFAAIIIFLSMCKPFTASKDKAPTREFEGVITYHEIEKNDITDVDDTVRLFYSHGNFVILHSEKSPKFHIVKDYYLENKPLRLFIFNTSDTLHKLNLNNPVEKLDSFRVKKTIEEILSRSCENIEVYTSYPTKDSTTYTDFNFVFSRGDLTIDKQHFQNWNLGFF